MPEELLLYDILLDQNVPIAITPRITQKHPPPAFHATPAGGAT